MTERRPKLLDDRQINFRCIAATHVDLNRAVEEGKFREDLFYRIAKDIVHVPALRERVEDIPELVHFFMTKSGEGKSLTSTKQSLELLQAYTWPGNVRQLKGVVDCLASRYEGDVICEKDVYKVVPEVAAMKSIPSRGLIGAYSASLIINERQRFEKAIIRANGNRTEAAKHLGISRATFFRRAKELGLVRPRTGENSDRGQVL